MVRAVMHPIELILVLLLAVAVLTTVAHKVGIAYPVVLVVGGISLGLLPGWPPLPLDPEAVFLLFVPPLVYAAAVFTPLREFRVNLRPILLLAVGLVLVTTVVVAAVAHACIVGIGWATAFVLGVVVAPSDAVAVMAVTEHYRLPRRVQAILEGESLANDATTFVAYRVAVAAVVTGTFSLAEAGLRFLWAAAGAVVLGLAVGWLAAWVRRQVHHTQTAILISLLTPYAAYLPAEAVDVSGVLAVVVAGLYVGRHGLGALAAEERLEGIAFWETLVFVLEGLAFLIIGLQVRDFPEGLAGMSLGDLLGYAALVGGTVILVRLAWVFPATYLPRALSWQFRRGETYPPWREVLFVGWSGMRGIDTLVTALALPLAVGAGRPLPHRNLIVFLAFATILVTLVLQGLSLPAVIRWLGLRGGRQAEREADRARLAVVRAVLEHLDQLARKVVGAPPETVRYLRRLYERRARRFEARAGADAEHRYEKEAVAAARLRRELIRVEREALWRLRERDEISDDVVREVEHDLDLEELQLEGWLDESAVGEAPAEDEAQAK
jgi:CPA1 family monovalent cation:H+ antiporter